MMLLLDTLQIYCFIDNQFSLLIKEFPINPKALNLAELYGEFNLATSEWMDGVISNIMRTSCACKFIIFKS